MSEFKPNELAERRAQEKSDCRLWTPKDALLACLRDIESGEINPECLAIHYSWVEDGENPDRLFSYYASNVTTLQHAGLLAMALSRITAP